MMILQDYMESGDKVQDEKTKTQHILPCTILVDTTVQNKSSSRLLNVILDRDRATTTIN